MLISTNNDYFRYLKRWIETFQMIGSWTAVTAQQTAAKIAFDTFIVILQKRKLQISNQGNLYQESKIVI